MTHALSLARCPLHHKSRPTALGHEKSPCKNRGVFSNTAKTTTGKKIVKDGVFIIKEIKKPGAALCGLLTANSITLLTLSIIYCKIIVSNSQLS